MTLTCLQELTKRSLVCLIPSSSKAFHEKSSWTSTVLEDDLPGAGPLAMNNAVGGTWRWQGTTFPEGPTGQSHLQPRSARQKFAFRPLFFTKASNAATVAVRGFCAFEAFWRAKRERLFLGSENNKSLVLHLTKKRHRRIPPFFSDASQDQCEILGLKLHHHQRQLRSLHLSVT